MLFEVPFHVSAYQIDEQESLVNDKKQLT